MVRRKKIRTRGKFSLSRFFQKFAEGDKVAVTIERSIQPRFPTRIQGRTGIVKEKKGRSYVILLKDGNKSKEYVIAPIHVKKLK